MSDSSRGLLSGEEKEVVGRIGFADRVAGLRPQPPAASSQSSVTLRGALAKALRDPSGLTALGFLIALAIMA